ncbi:MAG: zinc ABC transporter substrate-binding protein [Bacteroidales bacterium]|nr:zinc ABC transporter substrate-binding protein [Bacteroidales bacterium]
MKTISRHITFAVLATLAYAALLLSACRITSKTQPSVVVSIQPQRFLLEAIAGSKVEVMCLLTDESNPETYEPDMKVMMAIERSDAYFTMGTIGYELAILSKIKSNNPDLPIINTSKGVNFMDGHDADEGDVDPHVWVSVCNAKIIAANMYTHLVELYPQWKKYFTKRYQALQARLNKMDQEFTSRFQASADSVFLVWHPTLSYLARDYGLTQVSLDNGKEPTVNNLRSHLDLARQSGAKVLFIQPQIDSRQASELLSSLDVKKVNFNPMSSKWDEELYKFVDALAPKTQN